MKKMTDRGKKSKTLSEVKPVKNKSKNLQSFLEISPVQKEVLLDTPQQLHLNFGLNIIYNHYLIMNFKMCSMKKVINFSNVEEGKQNPPLEQ